MGLSDGAFFMIEHTPLPNGNHPISSPVCPMGVADTLEHNDPMFSIIIYESGEIFHFSAVFQSKCQKKLKWFFQANVSSKNKQMNSTLLYTYYETSGWLVFNHFLEQIEYTKKQGMTYCLVMKTIGNQPFTEADTHSSEMSTKN